jgi:hypothetical protein
MASAYDILNKLRLLVPERKILVERLLGESLEPPLEDCDVSINDYFICLKLKSATFNIDYNYLFKNSLKRYSKAKVKIIDSNVEEIHLIHDDEYIKLFSDVVHYKVNPLIHEANGFVGTTEFPHLKIDEIEKLVNEIVGNKTNNKIIEDLSSNFEKVIFNIFKNDPSKQVMISSNGLFKFSFEIQEGSSDSVKNIESVKLRNHGGTKLDAIDGEDVFIQLMNPILKHYNINYQFVLDRQAYKNMGDNGDFSYGTKRLDIKTRQRKKADYRYNLLVNQDIINKGFNEFILVHREGDHNLSGKQRRLTILGYATASQVQAKLPQKINGGMKYEVQMDELSNLKDLVIKIVQELIDIGL